MEPFKMHLVEMSGAPRERGRQHGEQMRPQIKAIFENGRESLEKAGGPSLEVLAAAFQQATGHLQAARQWTPDLVEELAGTAEGAGVDFGVLWAFQCQDESFWFSTGQLGLFARAPDQDRCSSLGSASFKDHPALLAQNLDTPMLYNGYQTLLHIRYPDSDRQAYVVTEPGLVGICGLNSSPLGVCQNTLAMKLNYDPGGLPAMLVARALIDQVDLASARGFLHEIHHASGINYMLADAHSVEDYECSTDQVVRFLQESMGLRIAHTNHPLSSNDRLDIKALSRETNQLYHLSNEHSTHRLFCISSKFLQEDGPADVDGIKQVLSTHEPPEYPVCRHYSAGMDSMRGMTNNSLIMVMGNPAELHIASGPPCISEFKTFSFN
jgi:isopenicillin-N N-acyltransferase like protein